MSGLGLRVCGEGRMRPAVMPEGWVIRDVMPRRGNGLRLQGDGMRHSGGRCCGCGMMDDQFIFADQAI